MRQRDVDESFRIIQTIIFSLLLFLRTYERGITMDCSDYDIKNDRSLT